MAAIINKFISYIKNNELLSNQFKKVIYNYRYRPNSQIVPIRDIEDCRKNIIQKLFGKNIFKNYFPNYLNENKKYIETLMPEISIYKFKNAFIDINSSAILCQNKLITYRTENERFNEGFITVHNAKYAKVDNKTIVNLDEGFFLGGNGSWNWFHFLIEIMPKLILFNEKLSRVLFVNEIILKTPSMKKILETASENKFEIKYLNSDKTYFIKKLYLINDFNHVQFNRFDQFIKAEGTFYHIETTRNFSDLILKKLSIRKDMPEKIFLYRKNTHRIAENQDQILEFLKDFGFVPISLEEFNIDEQASYFKEAKFIVGISGAAWANMLFSRNKPKAICFVPDNAKEFSAFSNLAEIFDVDFHAQPYLNEGNHANSNFIINFEKFVELFNSINGK